MDVEVLWRRYANEHSRAVRDELVLLYRPLVRYVAVRQAQGLPSSVEIDDLISYGVFGLVDAIEKYDLDRGVKFETYAINRIRGAITDELRKLDWAPRSVRSKARAIERSVSELEHELGRAPSEEELATGVGVSLQELRRSFVKIESASMRSLDRPLGHLDETSEPTTLADTLVSNSDLSLSVEMEEAAHMLAEGITRLAARERTVVALYYYEGMSLADIGKALNVSESRVCQLHTKAMVALQRTLAGQPV